MSICAACDVDGLGACWNQSTLMVVDRVRDIIGQPLPGVIAGRYIIARNGDTFEVWEATAPDILERRARGVESAAVARALAAALASERGL